MKMYKKIKTHSVKKEFIINGKMMYLNLKQTFHFNFRQHSKKSWMMELKIIYKALVLNLPEGEKLHIN
jgi:hypothetical protein